MGQGEGGALQQQKHEIILSISLREYSSGSVSLGYKEFVEILIRGMMSDLSFTRKF